MKLAIVGGGISGCIAAIHCARKGHEVTLWETTSSLGGVLLDIKTARGDYYNGCQYLQQGVIDKLGWLDGLIEFSHEYGSVTSLGNTTVRYMDDCAQPSFDGVVSLSQKSPIDASALQRLQAYGSNAEKLISWGQSFGDLKKLDWRCLIPMQLSRLHFPDDTEVTSLKMENRRANDLLALPRRLRGVHAESAWLPNEGFNQFFLRLHQTMRELGVSCRLNSPITPVFESGRFSIRSRSELIEVDKVVWTTNPIPLFKSIFGIRIETPPVKMKVLVGKISEGTQIPISTPYYWQVFDIDSSVVRLYVYELGGEIKYSAETFDSVDDSKAWQDVQKVMKHCGFGSEQQLAGIVKQHRYVNFSTKEFQVFETLSGDLLHHGIVPGGWQHYGREAKINYILPLIDRCLQTHTESVHV